MNSFILSNAKIVTPTQHFTGSVIIEDGIITDVKKEKLYSEGLDLDMKWLIPGCIDIHSDYLEKELHPRPSANFPTPFAFHFMDQRAAASGITTLFSAVAFSENKEAKRSYKKALEQSKMLQELSQKALINHYVHSRLDPNSELVVDYLGEMSDIAALRLVVVNESVPGQRQFRLEDLIIKRAKQYQISLDESERHLRAKIKELQAIDKRPEIQKAFSGKIPIGSHDDTTIEHVYKAVRFGATLSEMPTTIQAARKAKELGIWVCMGAPNFVRGGSHCGNLSCHEAMGENLVDMLCSDYHFPTMLGAVVKMVHEGVEPSKAINYVTLNPAEFLGMSEEIGSLEIGKKADLIVYYEDKQVPKVTHTFVNGRLKFIAESAGIYMG